MSEFFLAQTGSDPGFIPASLQSAFTTFVNYLPELIGALIVLLVGYLETPRASRYRGAVADTPRERRSS